MVGIVHTNIPWRFTPYTALPEILTIATFKDVHFREVNSGVVVVVNSTIPRTQVLCAEVGSVGEREIKT